MTERRFVSAWAFRMAKRAFAGLGALSRRRLTRGVLHYLSIGREPGGSLSVGVGLSRGFHFFGAI
jgi:hypothetical protein